MRASAPTLALVVVTTGGLANGQTTDLSEKNQVEVLRQAALDPSSQVPAGAPKTSLVLSASRDDAEASATLGGMLGQTLLEVKIAGPIAKTARDRPLVGLDGLAPSARVEFSVGRVAWSRPDEDAMTAICREATGNDDCDDEDLKDHKRLRRRFLEAAGSPMFFSVRGRLARNAFSFVKPDTFAAGQEEHTDFSVSGSFGIYRSRFGFLAASLDRQRTSRAPNPIELCTPLGSSGRLRCEDAVLGGPLRRDSTIAILSWRKLAPDGRWALAPRASRDFTRMITSLELPVYFLQDPKGGLAGGVTLGWRSDTKALALNLFVGAVLEPLATP